MTETEVHAGRCLFDQTAKFCGLVSKYFTIINAFISSHTKM